ncbi:MAG: hypothetical protein KatS3mg076_2401 [Candidatus Binatia bacterium]|nr:MAG: hypothetical protein KatS3mg076_2401 [Candidatus Binatia bacterium]
MVEAVGRLLLLFVFLPVVELALLIEIGRRIGTWETVFLVVGTGILGASLARRQGLGVLRRFQEETQAGKLPGDAIFDGVLILVAGALLVTPGVITDAVGFLCLMPPTRRLVKRAVWRWIERRIERGEVQMTVFVVGPGGPVVDVDPEERDEIRGPC